MNLKKSLCEIDKKLFLYFYEVKSKTVSLFSLLSIDDETLAYIKTQGEYKIWELQKRKFFKEEVLSHFWLATSDNKISFVFHFKQFHELRVTRLFNDDISIGKWYLKDGILRVFFKVGEDLYEIYIIANNDMPIHSALQSTNALKFEYLKIAPISFAKKGMEL